MGLSGVRAATFIHLNIVLGCGPRRLGSLAVQPPLVLPVLSFSKPAGTESLSRRVDSPPKRSIICLEGVGGPLFPSSQGLEFMARVAQGQRVRPMVVRAVIVAMVEFKRERRGTRLALRP